MPNKTNTSPQRGKAIPRHDCESCGKPLTGRRVRFCGHKCAISVYGAKAREAARQPRLVNCTVCQSQFTTTHSQGRYCSPDCRHKGHKAGWDRYAAKRPAKTEVERIAHNAVNLAIKQGRLSPQPCERCGNERADAHHPDYSKPLLVIWLCRSHHREVHGRNKPK